GHLLRIAAKDLDRDGALFLGVLRVLERPVDPAHEPLGAHHLGDHQAAAAVPLHETAECRVGHARHGRDGEWRPQLDVAKLHHCWFLVAGCWFLGFLLPTSYYLFPSSYFT